MNDILIQKCFNHPGREAAARCPECGRFFCRECVTEHQDRVLCASCLNMRLEKDSTKKRRLAAVLGLGQGLLGLWAAWLFFYFLANILVSIPSNFHEGVFW